MKWILFLVLSNLLYGQDISPTCQHNESTAELIPPTQAVLSKEVALYALKLTNNDRGESCPIRKYKFLVDTKRINLPDAIYLSDNQFTLKAGESTLRFFKIKTKYIRYDVVKFLRIRSNVNNIYSTIAIIHKKKCKRNLPSLSYQKVNESRLDFTIVNNDHGNCPKRHFIFETKSNQPINGRYYKDVVFVKSEGIEKTSFKLDGPLKEGQTISIYINNLKKFDIVNI